MLILISILNKSWSWLNDAAVNKKEFELTLFAIFSPGCSNVTYGLHVVITNQTITFRLDSASATEACHYSVNVMIGNVLLTYIHKCIF